MESGEVILKSRQVVQEAGLNPDIAANPLDFFDMVRDVIAEWPRKRQATTPWLKDFAAGLRRLRDNFETEVQADPLIIYRPAHQVSVDFHSSQARVRYFRAGNRSSKTQSGVADNYWILTGQHPWRPPQTPTAVAVIGVNFSKYAPTVFETKYLYGENGNPLSPVFPEGGKWFYRYDQKKHIIYIACPNCAREGKAASCKHPKSSIILFSDQEGPSVLQGGQYVQIQLDEQIREDFFPECLERIKTVRNSSIIVTETPLNGRAWWTHRRLTKDAIARTRIEGSEQILVSLHTIDQFAAGMTSHDLIRASMQLMEAPEIEARIYGRPAAFKETGVFDSFQISLMLDQIREPERCELAFQEELDGKKQVEELLYALRPEMPIVRVATQDGALRVWTPPEKDAQYVIGGDVAQGLSKRDPSCASVLKMVLAGYDIHFTMVAQLHGWLNPKTYAEELVKLAIYYNEALAVVERNGPGTEALRNLKEMGYWNIFVDQSDPAQTQFSTDPLMGINTDRSSKPVMIAALQQSILNRRTKKRTIEIWDSDTLDELGLFAQNKTVHGTMKFEAESGATDDRVMSLAVAVYAAKAFGIYDFRKDEQRRLAEEESKLSENERAVWRELRHQLNNPTEEL